ncbi:PREDICTED: uncharacterized protein C4orf51 homolog [Hipposideros armiger]|uniref:Uncharacterized protein C4orf51 homolog n=1 Tax=Hipposideros armiger TaxID=186990 RepID=A0A8B7SZD2_HIPAR|nr:PREDICTED: uncharacterized protein C4orf51 homolog [Hipposideros armiger]
MSSPNCSSCNPTLCRDGPQDTADVKGLFPHITSSFRKSLDVKHRVAHQILSGVFSPAPPNYEKSDARIKKPASENLINYNRRRTDFLRRVSIFLLVTQQWIPEVASPPEPWDSASKVASSEDSDADQYYVYSLGGPVSGM